MNKTDLLEKINYLTAINEYKEAAKLLEENKNTLIEEVDLLKSAISVFYKLNEMLTAEKYLELLEQKINLSDKYLVMACKISLKLKNNKHRDYSAQVIDKSSVDYRLYLALLEYYNQNFSSCLSILESCRKEARKDFEINKYLTISQYKIDKKSKKNSKNFKRTTKIDNTDDEITMLWIEYLFFNKEFNECQIMCSEIIKSSASSKLIAHAKEINSKITLMNSGQDEQSHKQEPQHQEIPNNSNYPIAYVSTRTLDEALDKLNEKIGLNGVKKSIQDLVSQIQFQKEREQNNYLDSSSERYNFIFMGNPGTGKTTIARLIGDILYHLDILESGHTVEVDRAALISENIGGTETQTLAALETAHGGVLFVDEAYAFAGSGNDFGPKAIDTIMKYMEDHKGDLTVIFAGYEKEINEKFFKINPGIESRISQHIVFDDYDEEEMLQIAKLVCKKDNYELSTDGEEAFKQKVATKRMTTSYANARDAELLIAQAKKELANLYIQKKEQGDEILDTDHYLLTAKCFGIDNALTAEEKIEKSYNQLESLIGLNSVKTQVKTMINRKKIQELSNIKAFESGAMHMRFVGNPGTGKTTVARIVSQIYTDLGILKTGKIIEATPADFIATHIGHTVPKTRELIESAYGGVILIDEAYGFITSQSSNSANFGKEALDEILVQMENNRDKILFIFAGYKEDIDRLLEVNDGLASRIPLEIEFEDYNFEELCEIFYKLIKDNGLKLSESGKIKAKEGIQLISDKRDSRFGNGRTIRNFYDRVIENHMNRCVTMSLLDEEDLVTITEDDF